jgi:hypothetical protein
VWDETIPFCRSITTSGGFGSRVVSAIVFLFRVGVSLVVGHSDVGLGQAHRGRRRSRVRRRDCGAGRLRPGGRCFGGGGRRLVGSGWVTSPPCSSRKKCTNSVPSVRIIGGASWVSRDGSRLLIS